MMAFRPFHTAPPYCFVASPTEYEFFIPTSELKSAASNWKQSRDYIESCIPLTTTVSLCHWEEGVAAVVQIKVLNWSQESSYKGSGDVTLQDHLAGRIVSKGHLEERDFEKSRVKFEVGIASHADIEKCHSKNKTLKLQVKVKVEEKGHWTVVNESMLPAEGEQNVE
jgi:hypothetical protein